MSFCKLDGVGIDVNVTVCEVPGGVGVGIKLYSHSLEGVVIGGVVEAGDTTGFAVPYLDGGGVEGAA